MSTLIGDDFDAVLAGAQVNDARSVERLYRSCAPIVLGYLRSHRVVDPEDVASDVFVSMLKAIGGFTGDERAFRSWLLTIAHHRMVDAVRKSRRTHEDPAPVETLVAESVDVIDGEVGALDRLESRGVLAAMEALTVDQRSTLMLRVLADLSVPEIARVLDKPESAVKALLRRGFASLRRSLTPDEPSEADR
jgi:RNA polymerase sigma-70 factor (ECF subfamily)